MSCEIELSFTKLWKIDTPGRHLLEGPVYSRAKHCLFFTDFFDRKIYSFDLNKVDVPPHCVFSFERHRCNGLCLKPDGNLVACTWNGFLNPNGNVWEVDKGLMHATTRVAVAEDNTRLKSPNDIAMDEEGGVYFTDMHAGRVYYHHENANAARSCFSTKLRSPNGITLSWESGAVNAVYIAESVKSPFRKPTVRKFEVIRPGVIGKQVAFHEFEKGRRLDGLALSDEGYLFVAEEQEVVVLDQQLERIGGRRLCERSPIIPSNMCFIDPTTFVVTSYRSYSEKAAAELFVGTIEHSR